MATPLTKAEWLDECAKLAKTYEEAMTDEAKGLVERLRDYGDRYDFEIHYDRIEAADHIEALEAENERLRERVKQLSEGWDAMGVKGQAIIDRLRVENDQLREALNQALLHRYGDWADIVRAALKGTDHD